MLQAHVWLTGEVGGGTVPTGMPVTDVSSLTLEPGDPSCLDWDCLADFLMSGLGDQ